jgi:hypothetical protein
VPTPEERVAELEDAIDMCLGIYERGLGKSQAARMNAEMIRILRVASVRHSEEYDTSIDEVRDVTTRALRLQTVELQAALETGLEMLRTMAGSNMLSTVLHDYARKLHDYVPQQSRMSLLTEAEALDSPLVKIMNDEPTHLDELTVLRYLVGVQRLAMNTDQTRVRDEYIAAERRRIGSNPNCPQCGFDLTSPSGGPQR